MASSIPGGTPAELSDDALTMFGIGFDDDGFHPYDPADVSWNESWFWDWYDDDGSEAGHCRIGCLPNQNRLWLWLYLYRDGEWLAVEQPYLDFGLLRRPLLAFDQPGVSLSYRILSPLRAGRLQVRTAARVVRGPRAGRVLPVAVDLEAHAVGVPHSTGQHTEPGHDSEDFDARRMEQPMTYAGTVTIGADQRAFAGRGERDHSWGPRYWMIEWSFLVLNGDALRLQGVEVRFPGDGTVEVGYLQDATGVHELESVKLTVERNEGLDDAAHGAGAVTADNGATFSFTFEEISSHEMDLSHVLDPPPARSVYRRTLLRAHPDDGGAPLLGWLEDHVLDVGA